MHYPDALIDTIRAGKYAVMPTDTIYGIVADAHNPDAVEQLYTVRTRDRSKPLIVLIADTTQIASFGIDPAQFTAITEQYWPGPVSIILPCADPALQYLHRGTGGIAFRLPANEDIRSLLRATGPVVAPSANPEHLPPATTIAEAQAYFGDTVSLYVDGGTIQGAPSTLLQINADGSVTKLR